MAEIQFRSGVDVTLIQHMGADHMLAAAAKVSVDPEAALALAKVEEAEGIKGFINYLMKHRHGTPFEAAAMTFFVRAPMFVWWEWVRHRIAHSFNLESSRYKQLEPIFFLPPRDRPMMKVDDWKPSRPKFTVCDDWYAYEALCANLRGSYKVAYEAYECNLRLKIDPGLARDCLPFGVYFSGWVTVNPRSLMAFLSLRTHEPEATFVSYPLIEIEEAARKVEAIFAELFPITYKAFCDNGRVGP